MFEVIMYEKNNSQCPVEEFLDTLDSKMKAKTLRTLELLQDKGPMVREPYSKHLNNGIFEARSKVGSDISRILFFFIWGERIVLTNGFIKKTEKTPQNEIDLAEKYRKDYIERFGEK